MLSFDFWYDFRWCPNVRDHVMWAFHRTLHMSPSALWPVIDVYDESCHLKPTTTMMTMAAFLLCLTNAEKWKHRNQQERTASMPSHDVKWCNLRCATPFVMQIVPRYSIHQTGDTRTQAHSPLFCRLKCGSQFQCFNYEFGGFVEESLLFCHTSIFSCLLFSGTSPSPPSLSRSLLAETLNSLAWWRSTKDPFWAYLILSDGSWLFIRNIIIFSQISRADTGNNQRTRHWNK